MYGMFVNFRGDQIFADFVSLSMTIYEVLRIYMVFKI